MDVFGSEVAGPDARAAAAGAQIDDDGDVLREHLVVRDAFVEGMFAAAAADAHSRERDICALEIEIDAGAPGGSQDAAPVGIGAGEGGFHQRRIRDGARDLFGGAIRGAPRTSISITRCAPSPSSTICRASDLQTLSSAAREFFVVAIFASDLRRAGLAVGQQRDRVVGGSVAIHGDGD